MRVEPVLTRHCAEIFLLGKSDQRVKSCFTFAARRRTNFNRRRVFSGSPLRGVQRLPHHVTTERLPSTGRSDGPATTCKTLIRNASAHVQQPNARRNRRNEPNATCAITGEPTRGLGPSALSSAGCRSVRSNPTSPGEKAARCNLLLLSALVTAAPRRCFDDPRVGREQSSRWSAPHVAL